MRRPPKTERWLLSEDRNRCPGFTRLLEGCASREGSAETGTGNKVWALREGVLRGVHTAQEELRTARYGVEKTPALSQTPVDRCALTARPFPRP